MVKGAVTFNTQMEHRERLNRLQRIRYYYQDSKTNQSAHVDDRMREAELEELGRFVGKLLGTDSVAHIKEICEGGDAF
ncbi:MAG TPA: hypothetical protein ACFCUC_17470 [Desulfobacterales bacterium]